MPEQVCAQTKSEGVILFFAKHQGEEWGSKIKTMYTLDYNFNVQPHFVLTSRVTPPPPSTLKNY